MDGSGEARQRGVEEGGRAVVPSETSLGEVTVTEERGDIVMARKTSNSGVGTNRKRSRNYGDGRRQSSTLLGKHLAAAALGLWLMSLLALRFITCLDTLRSHKAGSLGIFPGIASRRLAGRQDDEGLLVASAGDGGSQNGQRETSPAGSDGGADASRRRRCKVIIDIVLTRIDAVPEESTPPATSSQKDETPAAREKSYGSLDDDVFLPGDDGERKSPGTPSEEDEKSAGSTETDDSVDDIVFLSEDDEPTSPGTPSEENEYSAGSTETDDSMDDDVFLLGDDDEPTSPGTPSHEDETPDGSADVYESLEEEGEFFSDNDETSDALILTPPTEGSEMDLTDAYLENASVPQAELDVASDEPKPSAAPRKEDEMPTGPTGAEDPERERPLEDKWLPELINPAPLGNAVYIFLAALFAVFWAPPLYGSYGEEMLLQFATPFSLLLGTVASVLIAVLLGRRPQ